MHTLRLGTEVLTDRVSTCQIPIRSIRLTKLNFLYPLRLPSTTLLQLPTLQARLTTIHPTTSLTKKKEEAERAAAALKNSEADRLAVKERVERERYAREAKALRKHNEEIAEHDIAGHGSAASNDDEDDAANQAEDDQDGDDEEGDNQEDRPRVSHQGGHRLGGA